MIYPNFLKIGDTIGVPAPSDGAYDIQHINKQKNAKIKMEQLGYTIEQALKDSVISKLNIPIIYDADISHKGPCMTIINGAIAKISTKYGKGSIEFELK